MVKPTVLRCSLSLILSFSLLAWVGAGGTTGRITVAAAAPPAPAYYVNCSLGSDFNSGTTPGAPWRTLSRLNTTVLAAGSTVYLADGCQWDGGVTLYGTGTAERPITFTNYGAGSPPVVNRSNGHIATAITLAGPFMTVTGIDVTHATGVAVDAAGAGDVVTNMAISDAGEGVRARAANITITGVAASNLIMENNTPGGDDDFGAVGYDIEAPNATVTHDSCVNCKAPSYDFGHDGGFVEVWESGDDLRVADDWAQNDEGFLEVGGDEHGTHANNITIVDNVLDNDGDVVILHHDDGASLPATNFVFEQNTVYQTEPPDASQLFDWSPNATETVQNNIFEFDMPAGDVPTTHTNNLYYDTGDRPLGYPLGTGEVSGDPLFVNPTAGNFHLTAASPARRIGVTELDAPTDYDGVSRLAPPDAGAFQYTTTAPATVPLGEPGPVAHPTAPASLRLEITRVRASRRRGVTAHGTIARGFSGPLRLRVACTRSSTTIIRRARRGRFSGHLRLPRGCRSATRVRLSVSSRGSRRFASQVVSRLLHLRP